MADEMDDDDLDPDFTQEDENSSSDSDPEGEVRVFMAPPVEKAMADTDGDSGISNRALGGGGGLGINASLVMCRSFYF
jgi:hypothetical protein